MTVHPALEAAPVVAELIADAAVAERWGESSALAEYSVGALAAHLARSIETIRLYVEAPSPDPEATAVDAVRYYVAVLGDHDPLTSDLHVTVRERGGDKASAGQPALVAEVADHLDWLASTDLDLDLRVSVLDGVVIRLGDYLDTRLVEMLVHSHDLAGSVGLPIPPYSDVAWRTVAALLSAVAAERHGARTLALRLARPELGALGTFASPEGPA